LKIHQKRVLKGPLILKMKLWEVQKTRKYPDGIKRTLIVIDVKDNQKVLMDNRKRKGHHYHLDNKEFEYSYSTIEQLVEYFKSLVKIHLRFRL